MRSEKEMMDLILGVAEGDERIRGVYLNGSRTNPNAPKDIFQDYDFVYVVTETASFMEREDWIDVFGERLYMQMPERTDMLLGKDCDPDNCYGYLIQLADGNRIDFHLQTLPLSIEDMLKDRLCIALMDKDGVLPAIPASTDEDHWVKKPSREEYLCCCNEFWWILNNIGKGLWRGELPYAMDMLNLYLRPEFMKMLSWYIGVKTDFSRSVGKSGKYFSQFLQPDEMERFLRTYPAGNLDNIWNAVFVMCDFFHRAARKTGCALGYSYNETEAHNSRLLLDCTHELPPDAGEVLMVRRFKETDIDVVTKIWLEANLSAHDFIPASYWYDHYEDVKKRLGEAELYVYEDWKGIQGFAGIENSYVGGVFVRREKRSEGVGKALMTVMKSGRFKLHLHVYSKNTRAVAFYLREGFKILKKQIDSYTIQPEYEMLWRKEPQGSDERKGI